MSIGSNFEEILIGPERTLPYLFPKYKRSYQKQKHAVIFIQFIQFIRKAEVEIYSV